MKKKYKIIIFAIFCILITFCLIRFFSKGYSITYKVGKDKYEVKEIYTRNEKKERDSYYIEMTVNDIPYAMQFYHKFSKKRKLVEDILTYEGDYSCILPIIDGKAVTDIMCYKDNRYYYYASIIGQEKELDKFVREIDINIYDKDDWLDKSTDVQEKENIRYYYRNQVDQHIFFMSSLKGIYQIDDGIKKVDIFQKDIYQRDLSAQVGDYYVTADYSQQQQFRTFYFVDIASGKVTEAKAPNYVSFDAYVQGVVDDELYIYDRHNEKQYRINPKKKKIEEIGNSKKKVQFYQNGNWDEISVTKANKTQLFEMGIVDSDLSQFLEIYQVGGKKTGYYYLLEKVEDGYLVYRVPMQNKKIITYVAKVESDEDICFLDEYIYFQDKNKIKYFQDETGVRTLMEYNELEFNENIIFGMIKK